MVHQAEYFQELSDYIEDELAVWDETQDLETLISLSIHSDNQNCERCCCK